MKEAGTKTQEKRLSCYQEVANSLAKSGARHSTPSTHPENGEQSKQAVGASAGGSRKLRG
jgi:hypothetical protein